MKRRVYFHYQVFVANNAQSMAKFLNEFSRGGYVPYREIPLQDGNVMVIVRKMVTETEEGTEEVP